MNEKTVNGKQIFRISIYKPQELGAMSTEEIKAALELERYAVAQSLASPTGFTIKVSPKGGVMILGLGKFPITLYKSQWRNLLAPDKVEKILAFIEANDDVLSVKTDTAEEKALKAGFWPEAKPMPALKANDNGKVAA